MHPPSEGLRLDLSRARLRCCSSLFRQQAELSPRDVFRAGGITFFDLDGKTLLWIEFSAAIDANAAARAELNHERAQAMVVLKVRPDGIVSIDHCLGEIDIEARTVR
jgi:hypothetical protein